MTGIVVNYSASRQQLINAGENPHYYLERQGLFVVLGLIAMFIVVAHRLSPLRDRRDAALYHLALRARGRLRRRKKRARRRAMVQLREHHSDPTE